MSDRLTPATLPRLRSRPGVGLPPAPPEAVGIVHLGIGAFHRAHQAVYTEDAAAAAGDRRWGICGVTQRSNAVIGQLRPQGCRYAVLERGTDQVAVRVVGAVREVLSARDDPPAVRDRIADERVRVVTLTVTEQGYRYTAGGRLDLADPEVRADLAGRPPVTVVGQLVRGLAHRMTHSGAPLSVLPCDNLARGGALLRGLVLDFCAALPDGDRLADWIAGAVSFPSAVVDRIVPATTGDDTAEAERLLGLHDAGLVVAEPFRQWVIEDSFAAGRPAWERAGAVLTADTAPYEAAKLRLLNAAHSLLAYTGALAGYGTIAEAVRDPDLAGAAERLMRQDAGPTLTVPAGFDLAGYCDQVLARFANPALRHRTVQVATDGSRKLPLRLLDTVRDRLAAGAEPRWAALAVAAWMVYVARGTDVHGRELPLADPLAARLRAAAAGAGGAGAGGPGAGAGGVAGLVDRLLAVSEIFGDDLAGQPALRALLTDHVTRLWAGPLR